VVIGYNDAAAIGVTIDSMAAAGSSLEDKAVSVERLDEAPR
jgi:hypothetical protein